jgi:hypothetical protein
MVYFGLRGERLSIVVSLVAATAFMLQGIQSPQAFVQLKLTRRTRIRPGCDEWLGYAAHLS